MTLFKEVTQKLTPLERNLSEFLPGSKTLTPHGFLNPKCRVQPYPTQNLKFVQNPKLLDSQLCHGGEEVMPLIFMLEIAVFPYDRGQSFFCRRKSDPPKQKNPPKIRPKSVPERKNPPLSIQIPEKKPDLEQACFSSHKSLRTPRNQVKFLTPPPLCSSHRRSHDHQENQELLYKTIAS